MHTLLAGYIFLLGMLFGSFALVLADRTHAKKQWVRGRSVCEYCKHTLSARDLVPVLSWLLSSGKCRYCKKRLSAFYPLTELGLGIAFLVSYLSWDVAQGLINNAALIIWLSSLIVATALFVYDAKWYLLPSSFLYTYIGFAGVYRVVLWFGADEVSLGSHILSVCASLIVSTGVFWVLYRLSRGKWIGDGDITLGVAIGLFTGNALVSWLAIVIASLCGLLFAIPSIMATGGKKKALSLRVPFGPFLLIGLFIAVLYGLTLIDWYQRTFLYM
jgi:prepilin signal peptidase PulO-like enzyme (type II secretory pathway)